MPAIYHPYYDQEPTQISSTYEGRHVTLEANLINSPAGGGVVVAKDPVTFGNVADGYGVGVALNAGTGSDFIAIDTEGIFALDVVATDDEGASAVRIGDIIFINRTTCVLSKISSDTTNIVFGYALDAIASGTHGIAVKVHWDPWYDIYRDYVAAGAAEDALLIDVDDGTELVTGYGQGLQVVYRNIGDKTGDAEVHGINVDMIHTHDVPYDYAVALYQTVTGDPTIGFRAALSIYSDDIGDNTGACVGIDLGMAQTTEPAGRHAFMRMRAHTAEVCESLFLLEGGASMADFLFDFDNSQNPYQNAATNVDAAERLVLRVGANTRYIRLYSS